MLSEGFLGTAAPRVADLVLLLEISMGVAVLIGAWLARKKRFQLHAWCQSVVVLLNLVVIAVMMMRSFHIHVLPRFPAKLGRAYYSLATVHAGLEGATEIAGLYAKTCLVSRYSSRPQGPSSRPKPDCFRPPQGAST